jgi:hypothetical protein
VRKNNLSRFFLLNDYHKLHFVKLAVARGKNSDYKSIINRQDIKA